MDIFEFELRWRAYEGMSTMYDKNWSEEQLIDLVSLCPGNTLEKRLQEVTPEELRELTLSTYSQKKKDFLIAHGEEAIGGDTIQVYVDRLEYELKVIKEMGFNTYFLIVQDFIVWAKKHEIMVGPGRGSGAGSLLAYLTRITDIDPLPYGLLFERFLNPARVSMPDFDVDFEDTLRDKVIQYVIDHYGHEKVCAIGTYMQLASKAAFKDTARAMGIPFDKSNAISNLIVDASFSEMLKNESAFPEFAQQYRGDDTIKRAIDLGITLEGNLRQLGVHACGVIIAPEPVVTYTAVQPIERLQKEGEDVGDAMLVAQYDGKGLETIGLLKMDFLGLRNLSVIKNCIKILRAQAQQEGKELDPMYVKYFETMSFDPPLLDKHTFVEVFQKGNTTGIFQFEGEGMRRFLMQLKADNINDLVAMNALYRPGPMDFIPRYIARKHGEEEVSYMPDELRTQLVSLYGEEVADEENRKLWEDLDPIMGLTYGIAVYQEQLMFLVQAMAGFSLAEADILRRGIGKKILEVIEQLKKQFIKQSEEHKQYKPETSRYVYEKMIEPAARYSFNKSHSVCYSMIAYQTGYLKAHHPVEFYAALLRSKEEDSDKLSFFIDEVKEQGYVVNVPDVNTSFNHVSAINGEVCLGFLSVKGIGNEIGEFIEKERLKNGVYQSLEDFLKRCDEAINKKSLEGLIKSGALDRFGDRQTFMLAIKPLLQWGKMSQEASGGLFGGTALVSSITFEKVVETTVMQKVKMELDVFKTFVSVHPFDGLYGYLKKYTFISQCKDVEGYGDFRLLCFIKEIQRAKKKGFFVKVEDVSGTMEFFFSDKLDYKPFDVVEIIGYQGRRAGINKITTIHLDALVEKVKSTGRYKPEQTIFVVKSERAAGVSKLEKAKGEKAKAVEALVGGNENIEKPSESEQIADVHDSVLHDDTVVPAEGGEEKEEDQTLSFSLPDDVSVMMKVASVLKKMEGDILVFVQGKEKMLTKEGVEKLKELCTVC